MIVMVANNTHWLVHYWQGLYGGLGHLYSPARKERPYPHLPYALDNGAFASWKNSGEWDAEKFRVHVERYAFNGVRRPSWIVVPDRVGDMPSTLALWNEWAPLLDREYHLGLALAVQDGFEFSMLDDLALQPTLLFVGGSSWRWKKKIIEGIAEEGKPFHVGRCNTRANLAFCERYGALSVDGTGWFRGKEEQLLDLGTFLANQAGMPGEDVARVVRGSRKLREHARVLPL